MSKHGFKASLQKRDDSEHTASAPQTPASPAAPAANSAPAAPAASAAVSVEVARGWGSGPLRGFGVAGLADGALDPQVFVRLMRRGVGAPERVRLAPRALTLALAPPLSTAWVSLRRNFRVPDQKSMDFTPYFGDTDGSHEKIFGDLFDFDARQRAIDAGPLAMAAHHFGRFSRLRGILLAEVAQSKFGARSEAKGAAGALDDLAAEAEAALHRLAPEFGVGPDRVDRVTAGVSVAPCSCLLLTPSFGLFKKTGKSSAGPIQPHSATFSR